MLIMYFFFFFKQKTAYEMRISDWSSDVCSSDLQSKLQIVYSPELVRGKTASAISGQLTWRAALERLLAGSDLEWRVINDATIVIKKRTTPATSPSPQMGVSAEATHKGGVKEKNVKELDDVIIVGSRLGT